MSAGTFLDIKNKDRTASYDEILKECVYDNWRGYELRAKTISSIVQVLQEILKKSSCQEGKLHQINAQISLLEKKYVHPYPSPIWSEELEAYKFLKRKNADPEMVEKGIKHLEKKAKLSHLVAKVFEGIYSSSTFQINPATYLKQWIPTIQKNPQEEYAKVVKRLNSIQPYGSFSCPGRFYIKP